MATCFALIFIRQVHILLAFEHKTTHKNYHSLASPSTNLVRNKRDETKRER